MYKAALGVFAVAFMIMFVELVPSMLAFAGGTNP